VAVEGHVVIDVLHNLVQSFSLQSAHLVAAHAFFVRVPNHSCLVCCWLLFDMQR